jgi:NAD(P)-dependent dehydrogenase (short-subunit alcohol dehydrogenase family)
MELTGKVAVVTGAGSAPGIGNGRAAAVLLARHGARVALVDVVPERLAETAAMIEGESLCLPADVTSPEACAEAVRSTVDRWGRLDVLVNNVGILGPPGTVVDLDLDAWDRCQRVNVTSMVLMSRYAIPEVRLAGGGSIVNLSSVAGIAGGLTMLAYATSKGAILSLTRTMAAQHGPEGIRVNAVAPGFVYTPMVSAPGMTDEKREQRRVAAPLGTEGTGWDVAEAVVFLAGPASRWITGVTLPVDAGLTADGVGLSRPYDSRPAGKSAV